MVSNMMIIEISKWLKEIAIQLQILNRTTTSHYDEYRKIVEDQAD